jgi:hypothetical protein
MTECYTYKDVNVECTITDDGKMFITLRDASDRSMLLFVEVNRVL